MTNKEVVKIAGLLSVILICMTVAWTSSNTPVGTSVPDSVADELRGGVTHNSKFATDPTLYCQGGTCAQNINTYGELGTAHYTEAHCGVGFGCETYTKESGCNSE